MWEHAKGWVIGAVTLCFSWLGIAAVPVLILAALNLADYFTALFAARYRGEKLSSVKGFRGIAKKISMWMLVGVGIAMDILLRHAGQIVGISWPLSFVLGTLAAIWLICNEIISILENVRDTGVELPPFFMRLISAVKSKVEQEADILPEETQKKT